MINIRTLISSVMIGMIIAGMVYQPAIAITSQTNGLKVSPAIYSIKTTSGQNTANFTESVTNITDNLLAVNVTTRDFGAQNAYGSVGFYGSSYKPTSNPHSLSAAISLPSNEYLIQPHQTEVITVSINNINSLAPGGHYSAILFTPFIERNGGPNNQVNLQPSVASLIFLTTASGGTQSIKLDGYSAPQIGFKLPYMAYILLTNTGNTQLIPRGVLTLKDNFNGVVAQTVVNDNSGMILPSTSRLFTENLSFPKNYFRLPGFYHLVLSYHVDGSNSYQTVSKTFIFVNPVYIVFLVVLVIVAWILRVVFSKKHKNKRKLKKM